MKETYDDVLKKIKERFPNAKFSISCFNKIEDIENKILDNSADEIIYCDKYTIKKGNCMDYFIVKKRPDKSHIYYCDVIDELIKNDFIRNDCDHRYLESIGLYNSNRRNGNSIKVYGSFWGS